MSKYTLYLFIGILLEFSIAAEDKNFHDLIPNQLEHLPENVLVLKYHGKEYNPGNELKPSEVDETPEVSWPADSNKYHTLIMYDPDAPSREQPTFANFKHWLVVNIPGHNVQSGETIAEYFGSGPPKGTGLHRYIFVVYEQPEKIKFNEPKSGKLSRAHRAKFNVKEFLKKYNLKKLIAANYFNAQWEQFVDERNKKITN